MEVHTFGDLLVIFLVLGFVLEFVLRLCGSFGVHLWLCQAFGCSLGCLLGVFWRSWCPLLVLLELPWRAWGSLGILLGIILALWGSFGYLLELSQDSGSCLRTLLELSALLQCSGLSRVPSGRCACALEAAVELFLLSGSSKLHECEVSSRDRAGKLG